MYKQPESNDERQLKQVRSRCNELHVVQRLELVADADESMAIITAILAGINEDTAHLKKLLEVGSD